MSQQHIGLTAAEWRVMECLWERAPQTGREMTLLLEKTEGWSRSTTLTLLSRLEAKGAVGGNTAGGIKTFSPLLRREDAALRETESLLARVYNGSISMMVSTLTRKRALSQKEIDELYAMLKELEGGEDHD